MKAIRKSAGLKRRRGMAGAFGLAIASLAVPATLLASVPAAAHSYKLGTLEIGHFYAPPVANSGGAIAVYGPILDTGNEPAKLVGASSPIARSVAIVTKDGHPVTGGVVLAPGKPVSLAKWREHLLLTGLKDHPVSGSAFDLTLDFGKRGQLPIKVIVEATPSD